MFELNKNDNMVYRNLWDVIRKYLQFIVLNASMKKAKRSKVSDLCFCLN